MSAPRVTIDELVVSIPIDVKLWNQSSDRFWIPHLNLCGIQSIDRSLKPPSLLQQFEGGEYAWTCLLDEIDVLLKSDNTSRVIFGILTCPLIVACCVLVFLAFITAFTTTPDQGEMYMAIFMLVGIAFAILAGGREYQHKRKRAKIQKVLDDASLTQPRLSFLLKLERWFEGVKFFINVYTKAHAETCLQDLENTRHLLSDQEYEEKLQHILKDVARFQDLCRMRRFLSDVEFEEIKQGIMNEMFGQVVDQEAGNTHEKV